MKKLNSTLNLGDLITALYEEISKLTSNRRIQTELVYLALIDMQVSRKPGRL